LYKDDVKKGKPNCTMQQINTSYMQKIAENIMVLQFSSNTQLMQQFAVSQRARSPIRKTTGNHPVSSTLLGLFFVFLFFISVPRNDLRHCKLVIMDSKLPVAGW